MTPIAPPLLQAPAAQRPASLSGVAGWFEELVREHTPMAFAVAMRTVNDAAIAEDIVQESFLSVWRHARTYDRERGPLRAWLLTVVRNRAIDRVRSERSRPTSGAVELESMFELRSDADVWAEVGAGLDRETVRGALDRLPQEQRRTIELAYFGGLTHLEIANSMAIPLGTVKGRMRIGLQKLRDDLVRGQATRSRPQTSVRRRSS